MSLSPSDTQPHRHIHTPCSPRWQATEQLCLINGLICRPLCSVLFSFNKVLLCHCYRGRGNMEKTSESSSDAARRWQITPVIAACAPLALGEFVCQCKCVCMCVCLRVKLVLLSSWGCFGRLAGASDGTLASDWHSYGFSRWPFTQKALFPFGPRFLPTPC